MGTCRKANSPGEDSLHEKRVIQSGIWPLAVAKQIGLLHSGSLTCSCIAVCTMVSPAIPNDPFGPSVAQHCLPCSLMLNLFPLSPLLSQPLNVQSLLWLITSVLLLVCCLFCTLSALCLLACSLLGQL